MSDHDLTGAVWHKSSRSSGGNNCVEVCDNLPDIVAVRDTKNRDGGTLLFEHESWTGFIDDVKAGKFDR
ncbi:MULTISPECIES: DUF397 domain-containing protein [Actinoplanes]|uniref:DUF397 domain-containing protein n=1 Tax=Actinoplanes TaxID=1865 RepID=UPI0005F2B9BB|nr:MULTISPECIES: DUF397 domain-containing protein [Actinoplanes]GLY00613.1 hypothetical protein Acsp01_09920 [Actinoplanes sp. NBRC 101535]